MPVEISIILFLAALGIMPAMAILRGEKVFYLVATAAPLVGFFLLIWVSDVVRYFAGNRADFYYTLLLIESLALGVLFLRFRQLGFILRRLPHIGEMFLATVPFIVGWLIYSLFTDYASGSYRSILNADISAYHAAAENFFNSKYISTFSDQILITTTRWHIPAYFDIINSAFNPGRSSLEIGFAASYCLVFCLILFMSSWMSSLASVRTPWFFWILLSCGMLANSEPLRYLLSGFVPHTCSIFLVSTALVLVVFPRKLEAPGVSAVILTMLSAILIGTLSEAWMLLLLYMVLLGTVSFILQSANVKYIGVQILYLLLGFACAFPISLGILPFMFANTANVQFIGFVQPSFPFITDLLGIFPPLSLYAYFDYINQVQFGENFKSIFFNLGHGVGTLALMTIVYYAAKKSEITIKLHLFCVSVTLAILLIYNCVYLFIMPGGYPPLNYIYAKMSIIFAPFLLILIFWLMRNNKIIAIVILLAQAASITLFYNTMQQNKLTSTIATSIYSTCQKKQFDDLAITLPIRGHRGVEYIPQLTLIDKSAEMVFSALCPAVTFIDQSGAYFTAPAHQNKKIALLIPKARGLKLADPTSAKVRYEDSDFMLIETDRYFRNNETYLDPTMAVSQRARHRVAKALQEYIKTFFIPPAAGWTQTVEHRTPA